MNKQIAMVAFFFMVGLALIALTPGDPREIISRLGVSILAGSFFFLANSQLQKGQFRMIAYISWMFGGLVLLAIGILLKITVFGGR